MCSIVAYAYWCKAYLKEVCVSLQNISNFEFEIKFQTVLPPANPERTFEIHKVLTLLINSPLPPLPKENILNQLSKFKSQLCFEKLSPCFYHRYKANQLKGNV